MSVLKSVWWNASQRVGSTAKQNTTPPRWQPLLGVLGRPNLPSVNSGFRVD